MGFFSNATQKSSSKKNINNNFEKLTEFFEELRKAKNYKIDEKILKLQKELEQFFNSKFEEILLDDDLVNKNEQKQELTKFSDLKELFTISLYYPWSLNKKRIVVAGRFSAGKSSVINKLINNDILPTDVRPTTAISTQITNIKSRANSIIKTINYSSPKIVKSEILKNLVKEEMEAFPIHLADVIEYIVINNDYLGDDLLIIDTPGFDPADKKNLEKDEELMKKEFEKAHCIIWVMDVEDGDISKNALEILKTIKNKDLIVIVNKGDKKIPSDLTKVLHQVKKTLINNNIEYKKIISMGKNKNKMKFDKNAEILRNLIKNIKIDQFDIFYEIKSFLTNIYNLLIDEEKYSREKLDFYESLYNELANDFNTLNKILNLSNKENEYIISLAKKYINEHKRINNLKKYLDNMWKTEYPIFGDDKYYIPINQIDDFYELISDIDDAYLNKGFYIGQIFEFIDNEIIEIKNELKKIDKYIKQVNHAIKDIERIENLHKKYQLEKDEIELDFSIC